MSADDTPITPSKWRCEVESRDVVVEYWAVGDGLYIHSKTTWTHDALWAVGALWVAALPVAASFIVYGPLWVGLLIPAAFGAIVVACRRVGKRVEREWAAVVAGFADSQNGSPAREER